MYRDPRSSSSPLSPCKFAEPLLHISGARIWPTGWPHKAPHASIAKRDGAQYFAVPWPRLRHGQYDGLICLLFLARAVSPRRHRKARAPR